VRNGTDFPNTRLLGQRRPIDYSVWCSVIDRFRYCPCPGLGLLRDSTDRAGEPVKTIAETLGVRAATVYRHGMFVSIENVYAF